MAILTNFLNSIDNLRQSNSILIARVYYVGQANLVVIGRGKPVPKCGSNAHRIVDPAVFVDVGKPIPYIIKDMTSDDRKRVKKNLRNAGNIQATFVLITHWHYDHYAAAIQLLNEKKNNFDPDVWFLPSRDCPKSAMSLINKLEAAKKTIVYLDTVVTQLNSSACLTGVYQGTGPASDRNTCGYMLKVGSSLFAGDCSYQYWPSNLVMQCSQMKHLVVPHHGAKLEDADISILQGIQSSKGYAVVSVGDKLATGRKPYEYTRKNGLHSPGHPDSGHLNELPHCGFHVSCTLKAMKKGDKYKKLYLT